LFLLFIFSVDAGLHPKKNRPSVGTSYLGYRILHESNI
jgi:hypothetical protein